jgi:acetyltransferase
MVLCGLGGIFVEVLKDVNSAIAPVSKKEASEMIKNLKGYGIIKGTRGQEGINEEDFVDAIQKISALVAVAPEIAEMDLNPLLGNAKEVVTVDARIRIEKK